ncbi:transcription factor IIA, alpha/beta subunit [Thamnidium elegans]|nr:transcription factor IIA, alpha/beta subunit [Thamnidium elegans]
MSNAIVSNVYRFVIDDVINQVRGDFEDMGIDDAILQELQRSWESKVARSRVANFGFKDDGYYDEDGENSTAQAPLPGAAVNSNNDTPALQYPTEYAGQPAAASLANLATAAGRSQQQQQQQQHQQQQHQQQQHQQLQQQQHQQLQQQQHQQQQQQQNIQQQHQQQQGYGIAPPRMIPDPSTLANQYQMMPPNNNNASNNDSENPADLQLPGIARPNLPQNDGANDELTTEQIDQRIEDMIQSSQEEEPEISFTASSFSGEPLTLDTLPDSVKELMKDARERAIKAGALKSKTRISQLDGEGDEEVADEDDINSDLDDTDDDDDDGEGGEEIEHIILCLYDKVTRTKNKWKCILKDGIMLVNGRDYLFHRANGDFEW